MHISVTSRPLRCVYALLLSFLLFVVPTLSREETPAPTGHISNSALVVKMPPSALKKRQQENVPVSDDATSKTPLFASVDADKDGYLEVDELNKFIKQVIGGSDFDEQEEIVSGVTDVLENVLDVTVDSTSTKEVYQVFDGTKHQVSAAKLATYWKTLGKKYTVDEVVDWVTYALQLPQFAAKFRSAGVSGYDFPSLLENDGLAIEEDLGISSKLHKKQIKRGIQMVLLGMADLPLLVYITKTQVEPGQVAVFWTESADNGIPVHGYRLQRSIGALAPSSSSFSSSSTVSSNELSGNNSEGKSVVASSGRDNGGWTTVQVGFHLSYVDRQVKPGVVYQYRVQAWNCIGHSPWSEIEIVVGSSLAVPSSSSSTSFTEARASGAQQQFLSPSEASPRGGIIATFLSFYDGLVALVQVILALISVSMALSYAYFKHKQVIGAGEGAALGGVRGGRNNGGINGRVSLTKSGNNLNAMATGNSFVDTVVSSVVGTGSGGSAHDGDVRRRSLQFEAEDETEWDLTICCVCQKKLGWKDAVSEKVGKWNVFNRYRFKHICHFCHRAFCHKHGRATHSRMTPCGVPGSCVCSLCLREDRLHKQVIQETLKEQELASTREARAKSHDQ